jgi:hypothetical protein
VAPACWSETHKVWQAMSFRVILGSGWNFGPRLIKRAWFWVFSLRSDVGKNGRKGFCSLWRIRLTVRSNTLDLFSSSELGRAGLFSGEPLGWGRPPQTASLLESLAHLATGDPDATVRSRAQNLLNELDSRGFLTKDGSPLPSCAAQKYAEEIKSAPSGRYSIHQGPYYPHVWDAVHPSSEPPSLKEVRGAGSRREVPGWQAIQAGLAWGRR